MLRSALLNAWRVYYCDFVSSETRPPIQHPRRPRGRQKRAKLLKPGASESLQDGSLQAEEPLGIYP